jgi:hypothetical protein
LQVWMLVFACMLPSALRGCKDRHQVDSCCLHPTGCMWRLGKSKVQGVCRLTGRYMQFWALPDAHTVDERDWVHRQMLNKVHHPEGELCRPLNGRVVRTASDITAVIDELNRTLTPSLEEFRARTAPVNVNVHAHNNLDEDEHISVSEAAFDHALSTMHTDTRSMDYLERAESTGEGSQENCRQNRVAFGNRAFTETVVAASRASAQNSWEGSAIMQEDIDENVQRAATCDAATQPFFELRDGSAREIFLFSHNDATGNGARTEQDWGPMHLQISGQAACVRTAALAQRGAASSSLSMPTDVDEGLMLAVFTFPCMNNA